MEQEELPEYLRDVLKHLGPGSATIDCDITDALYNANCVEDFKDGVSTAMNSLIGEAECVKKMIVGEEEQIPVVHGEMTVDDARQIAFETLRSVVKQHGWEHFKDLVGRELDITDEMLDQAVELLFSEDKIGPKKEKSITSITSITKEEEEELQKLVDRYYVAEEEIDIALTELRNYGKECDCCLGDMAVFKQIFEGDFDEVHKACLRCGGTIE